MIQVKSALDQVTAVTRERFQEATHSEYDDLLRMDHFLTYPRLTVSILNFSITRMAYKYI